MCGCAPNATKFTSLLPSFEKSDLDAPILVGSNEIKDSAKLMHLPHYFEAGSGYLPDHKSDASTCLAVVVDPSDLDRLSITPQYDLDSSFAFGAAPTSESAAPAQKEKANWQNEDGASFLSVEDYQPEVEIVSY